MTALGVRCSNTDCHFAVLEGSQAIPVIREIKKIKFPKGFSKAESLNWFCQEIKKGVKSTIDP
jgi:hypothetical protein